MKTSPATKNWVAGNHQAILEKIHEPDINIALYDRETSLIEMEAQRLVTKNLDLTILGESMRVSDLIDESTELTGFNHLKTDVKHLLQLFEKVSGAKKFHVRLASVQSNMCQRFHTDVNDLRMLCTYVGPGTIWIKEEDLSDHELAALEGRDEVNIDSNRIQQSKTGQAILLKGAIYPKEGTKAVLHRSPSVEEIDTKRLLLRIDTDSFLSFE